MKFTKPEYLFIPIACLIISVNLIHMGVATESNEGVHAAWNGVNNNQLTIYYAYVGDWVTQTTPSTVSLTTATAPSNTATASPINHSTEISSRLMPLQPVSSAGSYATYAAAALVVVALLAILIVVMKKKRTSKSR
jgi:hypothetical protein